MKNEKVKMETEVQTRLEWAIASLKERIPGNPKPGRE